MFAARERHWRVCASQLMFRLHSTSRFPCSKNTAVLVLSKFSSWVLRLRLFFGFAGIRPATSRFSYYLFSKLKQSQEVLSVDSSMQPLLSFICEQKSSSQLHCFIDNDRVRRKGTIDTLLASLSYREGGRSQYRGFSCGCCGSFGTKPHRAWGLIATIRSDVNHIFHGKWNNCCR